MKRLTVYLTYVEKNNNKIQNVLSYIVKNERELAGRLGLHHGNVKKYELANLK
jgi:hypothetical protein